MNLLVVVSRSSFASFVRSRSVSDLVTVNFGLESRISADMVSPFTTALSARPNMTASPMVSTDFLSHVGLVRPSAAAVFQPGESVSSMLWISIGRPKFT